MLSLARFAEIARGVVTVNERIVVIVDTVTTVAFDPRAREKSGVAVLAAAFEACGTFRRETCGYTVLDRAQNGPYVAACAARTYARVSIGTSFAFRGLTGHAVCRASTCIWFRQAAETTVLGVRRNG